MGKLVNPFKARPCFFFLFFRVVYASLSVCVHTNGPTSTQGREVVGFYLWNDRGETADQYRTIYYAGKTLMQNGPWYLKLVFTPQPRFLAVNQMYLYSDLYGEIGSLNFNSICPDSDLRGRFYYGCYTSPDNPNYCDQNYRDQVKYCKTQYTMGTDTIVCGV